ncbi:hypothetical protein HMPREF1254_0187 [Prevotella sp. BV3P1]|nr:hypothetical protein HMPREF1254_0187 [Prevotella sp. BV3P1]
MKRKTQSRKVSWKKNAHYRTLFKNSWGESGKYKGIWYMTKAFVA